MLVVLNSLHSDVGINFTRFLSLFVIYCYFGFLLTLYQTNCDLKKTKNLVGNQNNFIGFFFVVVVVVVAFSSLFFNRRTVALQCRVGFCHTTMRICHNFVCVLTRAVCCAKSLQSCLTATLWTVACQAPLPMEFSRQECWSGLP